MKLPYGEGTWLAVPLKDTGFATGVVSRASPKGRILLAYLFGPRRLTLPSLADLDRLTPADALAKWMIGDLSLIQGEWPILGNCSTWNRVAWPMPQFLNREPMNGRLWRVTYDDTDPARFAGREPELGDGAGLERDQLFGAGAVEITLTKLLSDAKRGRDPRACLPDP